MKFLVNYLDFILESISKGKMRLYYSDKFRNILKRIEYKSPLTSFLLKCEDINHVKDDYTFIDVSDKNDKITLLQVNRIVRIDKDLKDSEEVPEELLKNKDFWTKYRTDMSIGKWVRRIASTVNILSLNDKLLEEFVNLYKSSFDGEDLLNFELVSGEDIKKYYFYKNYYKVSGQLGKSCMRYSECQDFFDIYIKNPEVCKLLILKSDEDPTKIIGRSLIWETNKGLYQDRIYTINDSDIFLFEEWADKNGCVYKYSNLETDLEVQLGNYEYEYYPYMDTFLCYNKNTKKLTSDEDIWPSKGYYKLRDTEGGYESDDFVWSDYENEYINRREAVYSDYINDWIYSYDAVTIENRDIIVPSGMSVYSEYNDNSYLKDDVFYSQIMSIYIPKDVAIEIICIDGEVDYIAKDRKDLYYEDNGKYYQRLYYIKNPYTDKYEFLENEEQIADFNLKLLKDIGYNDVEDIIEIRNKISESLKSEIKNVKINNDIIKNIENNYYYKYIKSAYWGFDKNKIPTPEDIFNLLKALICIPRHLRRRFNFYNVYEYTFSEIMDNNDNEVNKFKLYRESGLIRKMLYLNACFDHSLLPKDIYKKYLIINL
jgi:hypothetical protein